MKKLIPALITLCLFSVFYGTYERGIRGIVYTPYLASRVIENYELPKYSLETGKIINRETVYSGPKLVNPPWYTTIIHNLAMLSGVFIPFVIIIFFLGMLYLYRHNRDQKNLSFWLLALILLVVAFQTWAWGFFADPY